jgi:protein-arginine kinase activator protein McsA
MERLHGQEKDNARLRTKIEENDFENKQLILDEIEDMKKSEAKMEHEL